MNPPSAAVDKGTVSPGDTDCQAVPGVETRRPSATHANIRPQWPHIAPKYTVEERDAMGIGMVDRGMSADEVKAAAEAGTARAPRWDTPPTLRSPRLVHPVITRESVRQRRAGKASSEAAKLPPRDAVESVRQRLIRMVDLELAFEERKRNGKRDLERIRQLGRAAREAAALPELNAPRPRAPDAQPGGNRTPTGGLAGAILKAHRTTGPRVETQAAQEAHTTERPTGTRARTGRSAVRAHEQQHAPRGRRAR
jgi:hypothetical protein